MTEKRLYSLPSVIILSSITAYITCLIFTLLGYFDTPENSAKHFLYFVVIGTYMFVTFDIDLIEIPKIKLLRAILVYLIIVGLFIKGISNAIVMGYSKEVLWILVVLAILTFAWKPLILLRAPHVLYYGGDRVTYSLEAIIICAIISTITFAVFYELIIRTYPLFNALTMILVYVVLTTVAIIIWHTLFTGFVIGTIKEKGSAFAVVKEFSLSAERFFKKISKMHPAITSFITFLIAFILLVFVPYEHIFSLEITRSDVFGLLKSFAIVFAIFYLPFLYVSIRYRNAIEEARPEVVELYAGRTGSLYGLFKVRKGKPIMTIKKG